MAISHDHNFKNLILDYPRESLEFFAPLDAPARDDDIEITPVREEQTKDRLGDRFHAVDTPLKVRWQDGSREDAVFLLEEETDPPQFSPRRLLRYVSHLAELFDNDRVVPVVIFLRAAAAPAPLRIGGDRRGFARFDWVECRLKSMDAADHMDSDNIVARLNLVNMRYPPGQRLDVYHAAVRGLLDLEPDAHLREKYHDFIDFYIALTDNEREQYRREHPEEDATMVGMMQRARNEGLAEGERRGLAAGRQEGRQEGRAEGERAVLERLLRRRFGELGPGVGARLGRASPGELGTWTENVLDAATLDEVFGPGRS